MQVSKEVVEAISSDYLGIPEKILRVNKGLEVSADVIFINKLAFLVSVSKQLKFETIEYTPNRLDKELARSVNKVLDVYKNEAFQFILRIWTMIWTV